MLEKENLMTMIIKESNGLIGALHMSVQALISKESGVDASSLSESELTAKYLSRNTLRYMQRCFGGSQMKPTGLLKAALIKCIFNERVHTIDPATLEEDKAKCYNSLIKCGILTVGEHELLRFSSPMALKYYMDYLFPDRSLTDPGSITELVTKACESMSASVLRQSVARGGQFPKEAVFQHLFMRGLALFTQPDCAICPELSQVYPSSPSETSDRISGEIDFYLNGDLRWGIELLVNGAAIGEHIDRFVDGGKYSFLKVNDYAVVDFRGNDTGEVTNVALHEKRITVFFKLGDFSECKCLYLEEGKPIIASFRLAD